MPRVPKVTIAALAGLACALLSLVNPVAAQQIVLRLAVVPHGELRQLSVANQTSSDPIDVEFEDGRAEVALTTGTMQTEPRNIVILWSNGARSEFPVYLLPQFVGQDIELWFVRKGFGPDDQAAADALCRDSAALDVQSAFELVFGCREWVEYLERQSKTWSKPYLRALNGWLRGNNRLALTGRNVNGTVVSPFGYHEGLIRRLRDLLARYEARGHDVAAFRPLSIDEVRRVLREHDQHLIAFATTIPELINVGDFEFARELNEFAREAYVRTVVLGSEPSIYSVEADWFDGNDLRIVEWQNLTDPAANLLAPAVR